MLVVYDPLWAKACSRLIQGLAGFCLIAAVSTAAAAQGAFAANQPELILLEPDLPDMEGFDLITTLGQDRKQSPRFLILSNRMDPFALYHYSQKNVYGLVPKTIDLDSVLVGALRQAFDGQKFYPQSVHDALRKFRSDPDAFFKILSEREFELLPLYGTGYTNEQIAHIYGLHECTIKSHRNRILKKLGLHTSPELIRWAVRNGFVRNDSDRSGIQIRAVSL